MIDFQTGEIKDIVPCNLLTPEVESLSYAVGQAMEQFRKFALGSYLYSKLSQVPESILDLIALEFNTQYYDQTMLKEIKEQLIIQSMAWYIHAGTPSVLEEFLATVFDGGVVEEWYRYGGEPYFFKAVVEVGNHEIPVGYGLEVIKQIEIYKNVRSWLEALIFRISSNFIVPVYYENAIRFRTGFYPRYNLAFLNLDNTWKLDGRLLNSYDGDSRLDFYPVSLRIQVPVKRRVETGQRLRLFAGAREEIGLNTGYKIQAEARASPETEERFCIKTAVKEQSGAGPVRVMNLNVLDNEWTLNDSRKLNGGLTIL